MSVSPVQASPAAAELAADNAAASAEPCVSCGRPAGTPFCPHCGERRPADRRYAVMHFAHEAAESFTNADSTFLRTIWTLVRRPGELTAAYMRGQRVPYMRPLQLFLVLNVAYFLFATWAGSRVFDTPLRVHMNATVHKEVARRFVEARITARKITLDQYRVAFDAASTTQAKSLIVVMVPAFTIFVALVEAWRRRYAVQHLVFALHVFAALLLIIMAVGTAMELPIGLWVRWRGSAPPWYVVDQIVASAVLLTFGAYVTLALRRAYGDGRAAAVAKSIVLCFALGVVLFAYRFMLFFTTFWAT